MTPGSGAPVSGGSVPACHRCHCSAADAAFQQAREQVLRVHRRILAADERPGGLRRKRFPHLPLPRANALPKLVADDAEFWALLYPPLIARLCSRHLLPRAGTSLERALPVDGPSKITLVDQDPFNRVHLPPLLAPRA